jgi:hypothetical protein
MSEKLSRVAEVVVKLRPPSGEGNKQARGGSSSVDFQLNGQQMVVDGKGQARKEYQFDAVLPSTSSNMDMIQAVDPYIDFVMRGYNCFVVAHGAAASGKKFVLQGGAEDPDSLYGHLSESLFQRVKATSGATEYLVTVSMYQIQSRFIQDVLNPSAKVTLKIANHRVYGAYVEDIAELEVKNQDELIAFIKQGSRVVDLLKRRSTALGSAHVVLDIRVEGKQRNNPSVITQSLLRVVKLAGVRGVSIQRNEGLKSLHNVVDSLSTGADPLSVPFNHSELTKLMRPGLVGNAFCLFLGFVDEAEASESLTSLDLLQKIKGLKLTASLNFNSVNESIENLRRQIGVARGKLASTAHPSQMFHDVDKSWIDELDLLIRELNYVKQQTWARRRQRSHEVLAIRDKNIEAEGLHLCRMDEDGERGDDVGMRGKVDGLLTEVTTQLDEYLEVHEQLNPKRNKLRNLLKVKQSRGDVDAKDPQLTKLESDVTELEGHVDKLKKQLTIKQARLQAQMKLLMNQEANKAKLNMLVEDSSAQNHLEALEKYRRMKKEIYQGDELKAAIEKLEVSANRDLSNVEREFDKVPGAEGLKKIAMDSGRDFYESKINGKKMEHERNELWKIYLENVYRHRAQMEKLTEHMFVIFKNYRSHFEQQKNLAESRYREIVESSVQDSLKLQEENIKLRQMLEERR